MSSANVNPVEAPIRSPVPTPEAPGTGEASRSPAGPRVAYVMSRFPKLTETFVVNEMLALERDGASVEIFPLLREREEKRHPEAATLVERARFRGLLSPGTVAANLRQLLRAPPRYLGVLREVLVGTWGSANYFLGALVVFPKAVRFAEEMERLGVEHVHAHFANHPTVTAYVIRRLTGIPYSFTAHGHDLHVEQRMLCEKLATAAFAVTVSEYNRELMVEECGDRAREKVRVVHCGVDTEVFSPAEPSLASPSSGLFRLVCVASFEEVKGHRYLLEACRLLRDRGVSFECHLVGGGPLRERTEARIRAHGLGDAVKVTGPLPRSAVVHHLQHADAAVLASVRTPRGKREGIPVALMEAMSAELPVVASRLSGIPELVDHERTGLLVPPRDPSALADALERLSRDHDLRLRLGRAGRQKICREFDLQENARRLLTLLREEGGHRSRPKA